MVWLDIFSCSSLILIKLWILLITSFKLKGNHSYYYIDRGAINGMIQYNLRKIDFSSVSINFADLYSYKSILAKYKQHLEENKH